MPNIAVKRAVRTISGIQYGSVFLVGEDVFACSIDF